MADERGTVVYDVKNVYPGGGGTGATGNGGTDDTLAIQACINAALGNAVPASNTRIPVAPVYLPPGTYRITSDLLVQSAQGFRLEGAGAEQTILLLSGPGFVSAGLLIDGAAKCTFKGFSIRGDTTESAAGSPVPAAISLTWTINANRSTTSNVFDDIWIRNLNFQYGINCGAPAGTTRQVDGTTFRDIIIAGGGSAIYSYTNQWLGGIQLGNGSQGNQYDHVLVNVSSSGCQYGIFCNASGFEQYGGQPAANYTEYYLKPAAQILISGIQSQNSAIFAQGSGGSASVLVHLQDIYWSSAYTIGNGRWIQTGGAASHWLLENVRYYDSTASISPVIYISGSGSPEAMTAIGVQQAAPPSSGIQVFNTAGSAVAINYIQLKTDLTVLHNYPFWQLNSLNASLAAPYTNSTTTPSTILTVTVQNGVTYDLTCILVYSSNAASGAPVIGFGGTATFSAFILGALFGQGPPSAGGSGIISPAGTFTGPLYVLTTPQSLLIKGRITASSTGTFTVTGADSVGTATLTVNTLSSLMLTPAPGL